MLQVVRILVLLAVTGIGFPFVRGANQAGFELWFYVSKNLWVDRNIDELATLFGRAHQAGYTHVLLADSKFARLGDMDAHYFRNIDRVRKMAEESHLEIVPALFPIGYSNDLLWHDPNLIEGLPAKDALFVVENGHAHLRPDSDFRLRGGDFSDLTQWSWKDPSVEAENGSAVIRAKGQNARLVQKLRLTPFRQYHFSVRVRTQNFKGTPEVKVLAGNRGLNFNSLGVKATQDWTTHHVVFNSLENTEANLYLGCWDGQSGTLWFDDAALHDIGLVNVIRRDGAPLVVKRDGGPELVEGRDYDRVVDPRMGTKPWNGAYDVYHEPPLIRTSLPDGTRLRVSYYHAATVNDDQAVICPSEPRTIALLRDQARRMHAAWRASGYMMSHDEIRVLNQCAACQRRQMDAGALLADNVRTCIRILREINPGGKIYVWSDMFDPHHNAHKDYYLVRGDLAGSWEGLDRDVIVVPWYFEKRAQSLAWFAQRGHRQLLAGYYDQAPERIREWIEAGTKVNGVVGAMYTTWESRYADLDRFARIVRQFRGGQ